MLAELGLRALGRFIPDPTSYPGDHAPALSMTGRGVFDGRIGWKLAPGEVHEACSDFDLTYQVGPTGFRVARADSPVAHVQPSAGERPIVFIGDSFTFGSGVRWEETFAALVGTRTGHPVCNFGMASFGISQMWRVLCDYGLAERPALVVVTFIEDDLTRSTKAYRYRDGWVPKPLFGLRDGELRELNSADRPTSLLWELGQHTHLGQLWRRYSDKSGLRAAGGPRWELNRALLAAIHAACEEAGVPLAVVFIPHPGAWSPLPALAADLEQLEIEFLDLGTTPSADPRALYFAHDPHLNASGHAVLAKALSEFLDERGLVARD